MIYLLPMSNLSKNRIATFFVVLFMSILAAPTIIASIDNTIDISSFYCIEEEEGEGKNFKLFLENSITPIDKFFAIKTNISLMGYPYKTYAKPHLNLISPPPEFIL